MRPGASMKVGKAKVVTIIHYACKGKDAPGTFLSTKKRSRPEYPPDKTVVYKCDCCGATVGVERTNFGWQDEIVVYI